MEYTVRESTRARRLSITIQPDGTVTLIKPLRISVSKAEAFVSSHSDWILAMQETFKRSARMQETLYGPQVLLPKLRRGTGPYKDAQREARKRVVPLVEAFAKKGGYTYTSISIRNQKTRWGSCSSRGALSFNYRLIYLTPEELNYLVVHELAHTQHHNHGKAFWCEVERYVPEYAQLRKGLPRYTW